MTSTPRQSSDERPTTLPALLRRLQAEPGRPRITWYGDDGERVELSGAVLVNWVTKTTNLLVEEYDAAPGTSVLLDLPAHWRTLVWALAVWQAGAAVTPGSTPGDADVVVTDGPGRHPGAVDLVAVTLPALARTFPGPLPAGAVDAAAAVMTYPDTLGVVTATVEGAAALPGVTHGDLLRAAGTTAHRARVLLGAPDGPVTAGGLTALLEVLTADGSVVLASRSTAAALLLDPGRRTRLVTQEGITSDSLEVVTLSP